MRRIVVGILALLFLAAAAVVYFWFPEQDLVLGGFVRLGLILGVLWLALPDVERGPTRYVLAWLALCAAVIVIRPKLLPLVLIVWFVTWILKPRNWGKK